MIEQYLECCKEQCHEPLSRSTLFKIQELEVREASQRKSLQGLDNTAANGAEGFQTIETLVETLEKGGMEKQWCLRICQNLRDAKRYLKTDYRVHCQQYYSLALTTVESLRLVILLIPSSSILVRISINRLASNAKG